MDKNSQEQREPQGVGDAFMSGFKSGTRYAISPTERMVAAVILAGLWLAGCIALGFIGRTMYEFLSLGWELWDFIHDLVQNFLGLPVG